MRLSPATLDAIAACYDAAIEPGLWPSALQRLGESFGAQSCTFGTWDAARDPVRMPRSEGHEAFAQLWMANHGHAPDPHIERGRRLARGARAFVLEHDVSTAWERENLPYYREIADPGDRTWWAAINFAVGARRYCLPIYRSAGREPFTPEEASYAARAAPELARLVRLSERMADASVGVGLNMLERFRSAAIVVDAKGDVARSNRAAAALLDAGLHLHRGQLRMAGQRDGVDIGAYLMAGSEAADRRVQVLGREGQSALLVEVMPVAELGCAYFAPGVVVVTLTELAAARLTDPGAVMEAFGLTRAEALLAAEIAKGTGVGAAAAGLGVGIETARSQLRAIFAKTRTSRQAELVGLLANFRR